MENKNKLGVDYSKEDIVTLYEELDKLIAGEIDDQTLNRIEQINEILYVINPAAKTPRVEESWKDFERKYLFDLTLRKKINLYRLVRKNLLFTAIIVTILFSGSILVGANVFDIIHLWDDESVQVEQNVDIDTQDNQFTTFNNINELEDYLGFKIMQPHFNGINELSTNIEYYSSAKMIVIYYTEQDKSELISLKIKAVDGYSTIQFEKSEENVEIVKQNDVEYYIYKNNDFTKIQWAFNSWVYSLSGTFDNDEAKRIIESIY